MFCGCAAKGKVEVVIHDQVRREMGVSEGFGELALMYNAPRSASIRTVENSADSGLTKEKSFNFTFPRFLIFKCE